MAAQTVNWTPEVLARLDEMLDEGLGPSEIARRFGPPVTKNMIIGKMSRTNRISKKSWIYQTMEGRLQAMHDRMNALLGE